MADNDIFKRPVFVIFFWKEQMGLGCCRDLWVAAAVQRSVVVTSANSDRDRGDGKKLFRPIVQITIDEFLNMNAILGMQGSSRETPVALHMKSLHMKLSFEASLVLKRWQTAGRGQQAEGPTNRPQASQNISHSLSLCDWIELCFYSFSLSFHVKRYKYCCSK